jgi:hypothetical protein
MPAMPCHGTDDEGGNIRKQGDYRRKTESDEDIDKKNTSGNNAQINFTYSNFRTACGL